MPVRYIQKASKPLGVTDGTSQPPNVAAVGVDSDTGDFVFNAGTTLRTVPKTIVVAIPITASSVDTHVFIADDTYQVTGASEIHSVVGGASAAVDIKKCTGTQAPASGTSIRTSGTFDLTATINTTQSAVLTATIGTLQLAAGDKLSLDFSGTLTGLVGVVNIFLRRI